MSETGNLAERIRQIEAIRTIIGDAAADAAIAALRAEAAATQQRMEASDHSAITASPQTSAGGDIRDSAFGQANVVLRQITIAPGGTLIVGQPYPDLPPDPAALQQALATYLDTFLERYQYLPLQSLGVGGSGQLRVALNAVFVNLHTRTTISELASLFPSESVGRVGSKLPDPTDQLSADVRQWLDELLTEEERSLLLAPTLDANDDQRAMRHRLQVRLLAPRTALELIRHHRALVLLGDPGSGKSTVLRFLTLSFALAHRPDAERVPPELAWVGALPLPILVALRRFAGELTEPPADAGVLLGYIQRRLRGDQLDPLAQLFVERLERGEALVLCDGLDEVADDTRRAWVARAVALFQSRFPRSRLVLTSRPYAYREPCLLPEAFHTAHLEALAPDAQDDFIRRWYAAAQLTGTDLAGAERQQVAEDRARDLSEALGRQPRLREIGGNPLLLTMIARLHQERLRLPQQRAELYRECLLLLLEQWDQRRAEGEPAGLAATLGVREDIDRLALAQPIAYHLQVAGREEARQRELRDWLMPRFIDLAGSAEQARGMIDRFLTFLEGRSGLLIARDIKDYYALPHRTFQEYLAARELIYQGIEREEIIKRRAAPSWREVILLVVGQLVSVGKPPEARALAWALLEHPPESQEEADRIAILAGAFVEELAVAPGGEQQALRAEVVQRLVAIVEGGRLPAKERVEAAFLLGRLGDPRLPEPHQPAYWCAIPAGPFWFGDDREEALRKFELPHAYQIARFPVTNAAYQRFIEDGGYEPSRRWWTKHGRAWLKERGQREPVLWDDARFNAPTQPVVGVTWYEAAAYCAWLTHRGRREGWLPRDAELRLPTWLEWQRAARGTDKRRYPWGRPKPTPERANYNETGIGRPAPVGCFPAGAAPCGAHDMAGNVMEWTATPDDAPEAYKPQKDFTDISLVVRSYSDYSDAEEHLCCGARIRYIPGVRYYDQGFRVVWSLVLGQ